MHLDCTFTGTKTCSFTATVSESASKPTLSPTVVDSNKTTIALTGDSSKLIKYYSNASITTGAAARNSATLKSQKVTCGAQSITTATGTINAVESGTFTFSVTDSRGFTTSQTVNKTLINYIKPTCTLNAEAPTTSGVATLKISGSFFNGSFGTTANTLTIQYRMKKQGITYGNWNTVTAVTKSGNTYTVNVSITGLDYKQAYVFQARVIDKLNTVNSKEQARKTTPVFDWGKNDFNVNGSFSINNTTMTDYVVASGTDGIWTYRKWNSGIAECWGIYSASGVNLTTSHYSGFYYSSTISVSLPFAFVSAPVGTYSGGCSNYITFVTPAGQPTTTNAKFWIACLDAGAKSCSVSVGIMIRGKWK